MDLRTTSHSDLCLRTVSISEMVRRVVVSKMEHTTFKKREGVIMLDSLIKCIDKVPKEKLEKFGYFLDCIFLGQW